MDITEVPLLRQWRHHSDDFNAQVIAECGHTGVSIAAVARAHGLNANLLRNWINEKKPAEAKPAFLQVPIRAASAAADVVIEIRRGVATLQNCWPVSASAECGSWLRAWLK